MLRLKLDYAICEKLCVPAEGSAELPLTGAKSSLDAVLAAAEAQVPRPATLNDGKPFAIRAVRRDADGTPQKVFVDVAAPENTKIDLFAEGPDRFLGASPCRRRSQARRPVSTVLPSISMVCPPAPRPKVRN